MVTGPQLSPTLLMLLKLLSTSSMRDAKVASTSERAAGAAPAAIKAGATCTTGGSL
jgi:hypothetical protein